MLRRPEPAEGERSRDAGQAPENPRPTSELLADYAVLAEELRRRGVPGSDASEQGLRRGYARRLVAVALGGRVEANPAKAYDVVLGGGDLVDALAGFGGALVAASHDRRFFDELGVERVPDLGGGDGDV